MSERIRLEDERPQAGTRRDPGEDGTAASTGAVFDAAGRAQEPGRGGSPAVGRAIGGLQASAGNGALAALLGGVSGTGHATGQAQVRAGRTAIAGRTDTTVQPVVQREFDDDPAPDGEVATSADATATALADKPPTPGPSWTHVGPPSNSSYDVSGSLRAVANAVAGRTEAGSVTTTPTKDTETWAPDGGADKVTAARVTVDQVMELPTWTDKSKATPDQQTEWDRFKTAITTHETGHVSKDKTSFAGTHATKVGQAPADSNTRFDSVVAQAKTDNETYDTATQHGLTQGTGLNPNIDEVTKVP